jgi:hypothetical protein
MARGTYRPAVDATITVRLSSLLVWWEVERERLKDHPHLLENEEFRDTLELVSQQIQDDLDDLGVIFRDRLEEPEELRRGRRRRVRGNRLS